MTDALPLGYEFPDAFDPHAAEHLQRVESRDGTPFVVLAPLGSEPAVVHADVVEYDTADHPVLTGLLGLLLVGSVFLLPPMAIYSLVLPTSNAAVGVGLLAATIAIGWLLARLLLYRTVFGDWLWRFLEWNEHRSTIMAARKTHEVAA